MLPMHALNVLIQTTYPKISSATISPVILIDSTTHRTLAMYKVKSALGQEQSAQSKSTHNLAIESQAVSKQATKPWLHQHYFHEIQAVTLLTQRRIATSHLAKSINNEYLQMHVSTVPYSAMQCSAVRCCTALLSKLQHAAAGCVVFAVLCKVMSLNTK